MYNNLRKKPDTPQSHKYKIYRNLLNRLIKQAKVDYSLNVLKDNKNNYKKIWNIVNELVYNRKQKILDLLRSELKTQTKTHLFDLKEKFIKYFPCIDEKRGWKFIRNPF